MITQTKSAVREGLKADQDTEFNNGSKISSIVLTPSKTADLDVLGKVWGYLKYYHPSIAAGDYNWDAELFRILPRIIKAEDQFERNYILNSWITGLGKFDTGDNEDLEGKEVKIYPDLSWINIATLGPELVTSLKEIKSAKRARYHYYIGEKTDRFTNEREYNTMRYPDVGFQLLSLYRYWNIIQYYFPYKNLIHEDWNKVLMEFIPKFINVGSELEYKLTLLSLVARIHDTHANLWADETLNNYKGQKYAPLEITFVENKAVVTDYLDKTLGEKTGLRIGDIIEIVDNKTVDDIIREKLPFTSASNYPTQLREIASNLLRTNNATMSVEYRSGKKKVTAQIETYSTQRINIYSAFHKSDTCFKLINPKTSYIYPGLIKNNYLPTILEEVKKTNGLIIDFRCYPSEVILPTLGEYLVPEATRFVKFSLPSITTPGLYTMGEALTFGKNNTDYFNGKVVIIINETTQSHAEFTTMAFRKAPQAVVIGSTTAAADGDVAKFLLPGGVFTMISGLGVYYPDGTETQRVGIIPDIEVKPTIKGIREGRDELLEKAIQIIN